MSFFPAEGGQSQLTMAGGYEGAWILVWVIGRLPVNSGRWLRVWPLARIPLVSPFPLWHVVHPHMEDLLPLRVSGVLVEERGRGQSTWDVGSIVGARQAG